MGINANYMTLNTLYLIHYSYPPSTSVVKNGSLTVENATSNFGIGMTHGFYSGKWYWEVLVADVGQHLLGFLTLDDFDGQKSQPHNKFGSYLVYTNTSGQGIRYIEKSYSNISFSVSDGDIVQFALDRDNRKCWVGLNGTYIESGNPAGNSNPLFDSSDISATNGIFMPVFGTYGAQANKQTLNAGQDSSFVNQKTSGSANATDGNGFGDFYYTPPTGFLSACSNNVPTSTDIDPAGDDGETENPTKQFGVVTYTGNGNSAARTINGFNFSPDFIWVKSRSGAKNHMLVDSSRGGDKYMYSQATNAELTASNMITFGDSDGYVMRDDGTYLNENSGSYVAWGWKCAGGTTSTNNEGNHTCTLQANAKAGFSIMTLANYTSASGVTIGHGLDTAPAFYIHKSRASSGSWHVYHKSLGATKALILNSTTPPLTAIGYFANTEPTADVLSLGNTFAGTGDGLVYAWSEIEGYSKFGKYIANSSADGPFIYTGFRPRMVFIKMGAVEQDSWYVMDSARSTHNQIDTSLRWNTTNAEQSVSHTRIDFLSNGFKIRNNEASLNSTSYDPYYWGAWGDVPFKFNNTF
jgi:hypothetical protein